MLPISPDKIAYVIIRARDYDSGVNAWAGSGQRKGHGTALELHEFIAAMNEDERAALVALMWIGRETFEPEELADALLTAKTERGNRTEDYLMSEPRLADFLEAGLEAMGISPEDAEDDVQRPV